MTFSFGIINPRSGMQDLIEMMQSETMLYQLGYAVLEILSEHAFPELKSLFKELKHGGLEKLDDVE